MSSDPRDAPLENRARHRTDVLVVGAGFGGMYAVHQLRSAGFDVRAIEAGSGVGGTWYWNRYPGARCDVESLEYSYSFDPDLQQEWSWSERYAPQPELLRYAEHVADRFDLRERIEFDTRVTRAVYDDARGRWTVTTKPVVGRTVGGDDLGASAYVYDAQFVVMATGVLSSTNIPDFDGIDDFRTAGGSVVHTGRWPADGLDVSGRRVAVIGTGSSGVQAIPLLAQDADHLTVFQRTPTYATPAYNAPLDPDVEAEVKADYAGFRATLSRRATAFGASYPRPAGNALDHAPDERTRILDDRWRLGGFALSSAFTDTLLDPEANEVVAEFVRDKIRSVVTDPATAALLCPDQTFGCKRPCVDTGFYETFNRPDVTLVSVRDNPIERLTDTGIELADGSSFEFDTIVFATGYDAMTGSLLRIDIRGRDGLPLGDAWAAGPRTMLGLGIPGFPNLFTVTGPGSPSVLANMITAVEQHVDWISACLVWLRENDRSTIEADETAADRWVDHVNQLVDGTLYPTCNSWYLGANVPGKPRVFMPALGWPRYVDACDAVAAADYAGFHTA
ncbi:flavin-containing monooxygenase [Ilumatobacter sp.]|uniref:flavin-containing monooxygenase n=1 Tax=Ilumatobacter sp. TaxID=1967498 RepID=UPI003C6B153A